MAEMKHLLGCIADDFTGASDAASFLQKAGLQTILLNGVPEQGLGMNEYDAIVIALKTRTEPAGEAVEHTMEAVKWLEQHGAAQYYLKYCSTFDSTKEGNIGPVLDAVLEYLEETYTVLCPSLPVNGRTVKDGHLYVNGVPLDESPMKDHPLTPMWDSRIKHLMEAQSKYKCIELNGEQLKEDNIDAYLLKEKEGQKHFYVIPDYETEEDAKRIVSLFGNKKVLSGGSGILQYLARGNKKGIVLAGRCSQATLTQIETYKKAGHAAYKIYPEKLVSGEVTVEEILEFVSLHPDDYVLVYSSDTAEQVRESQKLGKEQVAQMIENVISDLAGQLRDKGYKHIVVAGGETSGAVTKRLGYYLFEIGKSVAPGVPVMTPLEDRTMRLVLKSGNFGQPDFFERAVQMIRGE